MALLALFGLIFFVVIYRICQKYCEKRREGNSSEVETAEYKEDGTPSP